MVPAAVAPTEIRVASHVADPCPDGRPIPTDPDALLSTGEAAFLCAMSPRSLEKWRVVGGGPLFVRLGRATRYRRRDLVEWSERRRRKSTSDRGEAA
ncbi:MAG TPA: helix-turn-helix domain-containing protein [Stellaceae bacterium]